MTTEFQAICDAYLASNMSKHRIQLLEVTVELVHSVSCRARPKTKKFENVESDKMLAQKLIEPDQTERAAPIVSDPKRDGTLCFHADYSRLYALIRKIHVSYPKNRWMH